MNKYILLLLVSALFTSQHSYGQWYGEQWLKVTSVQINTGFMSLSLNRGNKGEKEDFEKLMPDSEILTSDFTGFRKDDYYYFDPRTVFNVLLGMQFFDREYGYKRNPELRIGLNYFSGFVLNGYWDKEDRMVIDTLNSPRTGRSYFIDSVTSSSFNMEHWMEDIHLDVSVIFRTNSEDRWTLFAGFGITAGRSILSETEISFQENGYIETRSTEGTILQRDYTGGSSTYKFERRTQINNWGCSAYVPLGVDFRIGKRRENLKHMHLCYEIRPTLQYLSLPGFGTLLNSGAQHTLGLRVNW